MAPMRMCCECNSVPPKRENGSKDNGGSAAKADDQEKPKSTEERLADAVRDAKV